MIISADTADFHQKCEENVKNKGELFSLRLDAAARLAEKSRYLAEIEQFRLHKRRAGTGTAASGNMTKKK
ncbi:hypothetical protein [Agathobaculum desmolans]|uniref:hypothetical protein n=1 Tax=Agathobaculum desmolans TaxID=39484 RepID=UPI00248DB053|nr:hypothetical protein [Agathobaculum desmolans]